MNKSTLTLKFKGIEANLLDEMVESGLFNTKSEAIRAALVDYSMDLGLLTREKIWEQIEKFPRRKVSEKQLAKDIKGLENVRKSFGSLKFKKPTQQIMDEIDEGYD